MLLDKSFFAVASKVACTDGSQIISLAGNSNTAGNAWLQIHDAKALPANASVPKFSFPLYAASPFFHSDDVKAAQFLNGIVFAVSSTQATLTISAETVDIEYQVQTSSFSGDGTTAGGFTIAGDYTSAASGLTVWANGAGPKTLVRLEFTSLTDAGADRYAMVFADTPGTVNKPQCGSPFLLTENTSADLSFNSVPFERVSGVEYNGCIVRVGTWDPSTRLFVTDNTPNYAIKGTYKA